MMTKNASLKKKKKEKLKDDMEAETEVKPPGTGIDPRFQTPDLRTKKSGTNDHDADLQDEEEASMPSIA